MTALDRPDTGATVAFTRPLPQLQDRGARAPERLSIAFDEDSRALWCRIGAGGRRTLSPGLLDDLAQAFAELRAAPEPAAQFLVLDADPRGAFSLGLDLQGLSGLLRRGDRDGLRAYLSAYAGVLHGAAAGFGLPLVSLALIRGDAVGAGLELALACDLVVAERGARLGFAEPLLGLPDTGASLLVARRLGPERAAEVLGSGRLYGAEELLDLGLIDVLAEPGAGEAAAREALAKAARRYNAQQAVYAVRRRVSPVDGDMLQDLASAWVEAALAMGPAARRVLDRLAAAQAAPGSEPEQPASWSVFE